MKRKYIILTALSILAIFLFLRHPLLSYFSQDDFYHFSEVWDKNISDVPGLLIPGSVTTQFYRPITRELYNLFAYKTFQLWAFPYHLINLSFILVNGFIFLVILKKFIDNRYFLFFSGWIYLFSAVHSVELYYLPSIQTLIASFFMLLSLLFYLEFRNRNYLKFYLPAVFFFLLSLLSHESSMIFPLLLIILEIFYLRTYRLDLIKSAVLRILPFLFILIARVLIAVIFLQMPKEEVYQPVFSLGSIFNSLAWFVIWSFGLPEMLVDFATLTLKFNPNLLKFYGQYFYFIFPLFGLILISIFVIAVYLFKQGSILRREIFLFAVFFLTSVSPFLFLPLHKFVYYLSFPLLWFCALLGCIFYFYCATGKTSQLLIGLLLFSLTVISMETIDINRITYWAAKRAAFAKYLVNDLKERYPTVPESTIFYIKNDPIYPFISNEWGTSSKQAFYILSGPDALRLIYRDSSLKAYYESVSGLPLEIGPNKLIIYEARFPY